MFDDSCRSNGGEEEERDEESLDCERHCCGFPASRVIPMGPKRQGSFHMEGESNPDGGCHHRPVLPLGLPRPDLFYMFCLRNPEARDL
ncbi:hypothetical protein HID58_065101 [Brassica napus]|uniref:Uncharacterized protein n=1 Tax=Brassica napus TaxID=3708 RepID=A0ABQ7ZBU7_BRANA|nr:hypothetical protein HID58_065101 [Brassica napus]